MPELPEVETTLRGIKPAIDQQRVTDIIVRHPHLRWPIPSDLKQQMKGHFVKRAYRRGKYILLDLEIGTLILHLGMSGRISLLSKPLAAQKHDHVDIYFSNKKYLRFTDPRRFGALIWTTEDPSLHPLIKNIGPEPLTSAFDGDYLWKKAAKRKVAVKSFIMDGKIVAGVGNIYATEALFLAGIKPTKAAGKVTYAQYQSLAKAIKIVLQKAIKKGGTTLKDFAGSDGHPGYFSLELNAYGQAGKPCPRCKTIKLKSIRQGQRSTVYCSQCQT